MRLALFLMMLAGIPVLVDAHPGKTDRYGGHRCLKECAEWKLYYQEYHLHDQEGRPVRVARKRQPRAKKTTQEPPQETAAVVPEAPEPAIVLPQVQAPAAAAVPAAGQKSSLLYWILLLLLLLLLLLQQRKERRQ